MKRISALLLTTLFFLGGCSFDPEAARVSDDIQSGGWDVNHDRDGFEPSDVEPESDADIDEHNQSPSNQDPGNQDPGNQDPGNQDPGNQDPGNQDPGNQDPGNQDPGNQDPGEPIVDPPSPIITCNGGEVDSSTSTEHCGECNNSCDPTFGACASGECACPTGFGACGDENRCENLARDSRHCGECGNECGPGQFCDDGQCVCRQGLTLCNGRCVDTRIDPLNCGGCGNSCGAQTRHCLNGSCTYNCLAQGYSCKPPGADGVACTSRMVPSVLYCAPSSPGNRCGTECGADQVCLSNAGCRDFRPARGCNHCPCNDCGADEDCRNDISGIDGPYCVKRSS